MAQNTEFPFAEGRIFREDRTFTMMDGTVLHAHRYESSRKPRKGRKHWEARPTKLLVMPDPDTTMRSVEPFILALLSREDAPKAVWTFDGRGRGQSGSDGEDRGLDKASGDLLALCDGANLHHCDIVANGRAAQVVFASAPKRPTLARRLVLNDGPPELDSVGLARLSALRKRLRAPKDWEDAATLLRDTTPGKFEAFTETDWTERARAVWHEVKGKIVPDAHASLAQAGVDIDFDGPQPSMWTEFAVLKRLPMLLVRGEASPLVTDALATRLRERHPRLDDHVARGQGHIAELSKPDVLDRVAGFLAD
ncbi:hypothetical protein N9H93_00985 [Rhizobiaceae bacterium]|nr:hypothetical protein [Rhizobiaceae bacterium]